MNFRTLLMLSILSVVLLATRCGGESYDYCYGVNETNMPPRVVMIENSRSAERYELRGNDQRLHWNNFIVGDDFLIGSEAELTLNEPSCANIDGFEDVRFLNVGNVTREMSRSGGGRCTSLAFDASSNDSALVLTGMKCFYCLNVFYNMMARVVNRPAILDHGDASWSYVSVSSTYAGKDLVWSNDPLNETDLYAQETEDGSPPLVIARVWAFENTPEMAEAKAYLGIESDEPIIRCGDLYYGYYAR